jgi:hypothetical protein
MTASQAYQLTLLYPDERRVILTVPGVHGSMAGGVSAVRSSIVVQRRTGPRRVTECTVVFDDFGELAGTDAALASLRAVVRGDLRAAAARADEAAEQHMGWRPLRALVDRVPDESPAPPRVLPSHAEPLGEYPSLAAYFQAQLEDYLHPAGLWILDYLDMPRVRARFEAAHYHYLKVGSTIYRVTR